MPTPAAIVVSRLLEAKEDPLHGFDPKKFDAKDFIIQLGAEEKAGIVTPEVAMTANTFYHRTQKYKSGGAYKARRNGRTQTWKSRPGEFRIPIKIGLYDHGNITHANAHEWSTNPDVA